MQAGKGRMLATLILAIVVGGCAWHWWPNGVEEERVLSGLQKVAFVAAAFAVTAYNLRTRVVDLVLKVEGNPSRVADFCRIARACGKRLTNLVVLFTGSAAWMGSLSVIPAGGLVARVAGAASIALFAACLVSFLYIIFAFERLERFALDEAEKTASRKEGERLFGPAE